MQFPKQYFPVAKPHAPRQIRLEKLRPTEILRVFRHREHFPLALKPKEAENNLMKLVTPDHALAPIKTTKVALR